MSEPAWIDADELVEFNRLTVEDTGKPHLLLHPDMLDSAVHRPRQVRDIGGVEDVVALGCALAASIPQNHPCQQANKRTAQAALFRFLWINGYTFRDPDDAALAELLIALIEHELSEEEYAAAIDRHVVER
ncbi:Fic family protein [Sphingomonas bacterium]|uniref:type II toxin-antitoxin system death-on-curing family toxin n=1 Tax=Sphingomonas bacterium TaxID=1895847 RepID=UPI002621D908|nr:Fic family protein [Sphingomonas bacterium]MDB5678991.1 Fic/DOC family protein [Sphingomonas bacterium]